MDLQLSGRRALVTGGSKGIGRAIALEFAREGAHVALCARDGGPLEEVASELRGLGVKVHAAKADVTVAADVNRFVADAAAALDGIDILVNNAGGAIPGDFTTLTDEQWQADVDVKLFSTIRCTRAAYPHLKRSPAARIINIGAVFAHFPNPKFLAATTLRAAGHNLGKALAMQFAEDRILVNTVHIGYVDTPQWHNIHQRRAPEVPRESFLDELAAAEVPLGRFGRADEVAGIVAFLASDRASYITGVDIDVAGGMGIST